MDRGPADLNPNPNAPEYLQPVREALFRDSINEAVSLLKKMQGPNSAIYQPLGNLMISQQLDGEVSNYERELNISTAVATTRFTVGGVNYSGWDIFLCTRPLIVIRLTADKAQAINIRVNVNHDLRYRKEITPAKELVLNGKARSSNEDLGNQQHLFVYEDRQGCNGMRFQFRVKAVTNEWEYSRADTSLLRWQCYWSFATGFRRNKL